MFKTSLLMEDFITCVYIQAPLGQAFVGDTYIKETNIRMKIISCFKFLIFLLDNNQLILFLFDLLGLFAQ